MNQQFIMRHWYASVYEQYENYTNDVEFFIKILREQLTAKPLKILEAACGGGRISIPLAQAGHNVTGFDANEFMLMRCYNRMQGLPNITCYQADALTSDWGKNYDVVVMAGNVLINIEGAKDYIEAQRTFISKAAKALRVGGHLLLEYDQHTDESAIKFFNGLGESSYFNGTDEMGTCGRTVSYGGTYNPVTRLWVGTGHTELTLNNGESYIDTSDQVRFKHIPSQAQVYRWLDDAGFIIERTYLNYSDEPLPNPVTEYSKATILAVKK